MYACEDQKHQIVQVITCGYKRARHAREKKQRFLYVHLSSSFDTSSWINLPPVLGLKIFRKIKTANKKTEHTEDRERENEKREREREE